ncbi:LysR family transcriptional regulator [Polycyclovorans algicola]|uniref:LysR family transcriptional regulator n=1 Tax=Polycyclovorans algicola TaxID=616992 RepID=UPI0004A71FD7|nr:LysR family transcriptional regulator [Polycyclovorans algicola]
MNLNHLAIFQAVAANGSVSRGAQRLHISQSAVSKQLGEFERALGVVLFDRLPRGVRLTEAGRLLLGYANRLFAIEAEARSALGDLKQQARGSLTIGASRTIGSYLLPQRLAAFRQRYPAVELSLQVENTHVIERKLLAGEIDIGFTEGVVSSEQLDYSEFAQDELVLIAAPRHPAAKQGSMTLATLQDLRLLMHEIGSGTRAVTELALAEKGLRIRPSMTLASTEAIKHTVAAGAGLAFLSSLSIKTEQRARRLTVLNVDGLRIARALYQVRLRNTPPGPTLAAFLDVLQAPA